MRELFLEYSIYIYVTLGMTITWFVQLYKSKVSHTSWWERAKDSFICSLFTASVCMPLLESFPHIPQSITLFIGGVVGTLGFQGWQSFSRSVLGFVSGKLNQGQPMPCEDRIAKQPTVDTPRKHEPRSEHNRYVNAQHDEPPMPTDRRNH